MRSPRRICFGLFRVAEDPFDPQHRFTTSWLLGPRALAVARGVMLVYILFCLAFKPPNTCDNNPANDAHEICDPTIPRGDWVYFTTLSWVGLLMYSVLAFVFTIVEALGKASPLGHLWKIVCLFHSFLYTTIVTFPFLVTGMYWAALTDGTEWTRLWPTWNNISFHVLNALFAAFEVVVPCTNLMPWCHLIGLYILLALYVALSSANFQLRGWWPYPFLGEVMKREERSWIWPLVVITGTAGVFLIVQFCVWLRKLSTERKKRSEAFEATELDLV